ncbi:hypothetical protein EG830_02265 [bacterium]|nr:hypothetical protein [bacterium]
MKPFLPDIPVIYFHSVGVRSSAWSRSFLTTSIEDADRFFRFVSGRYRSLHLKEYYDIRSGLSEAVANPIVITFDDGYLDNWIHAFPLLKKYSLKATIFVSPEFVDGREIIRVDDSAPGFLSWSEMREMAASGLIDIQSHTLTHTKYFTSDRLTGFHHPGNDILYAAGNLFPERKPYHIGDKDFEKLLPYGYPLFEETSAVTARRVTINDDLTGEIVDKLSGYDFSRYKFSEAFGKIRHIYEKYRNDNLVITRRETEEEYSERIDREIIGSKEIIERELGREVEFLCWPHGDNNSFLHRKALDAGYLMTSIGHSVMEEDEIPSRIPERLGIDYSSFRRRVKTRFKLKAFSGIFPHRQAVLLARSVNSAR